MADDRTPAPVRIAVRVFASTTRLIRRRLRPALRQDLDRTFAAVSRSRYQNQGTLALFAYLARNTIAVVIEAAGASGADERRAPRWLNGLSTDARFAVRSLSRAPGFAALAVTTVAAGIAVNATVFSVFEATMLRPLPYTEPDRLIAVHTTFQETAFWSSSLADVLEWRESSTALDAIAFVRPDAFSVVRDDVAMTVPAARVTANFFEVLGVEATSGRTFAPGEDTAGADPVAVLSHGYYVRTFGADRGIGSTLIVDGEPVAVVGVLPPSFRADLAGGADIWVTRRFAPEDAIQRARIYRPIARLADGVSLSAAQAELDRIAVLIAERNPEAMGGWGVRLRFLQETLTQSSAQPLTVLLGAVVLVLLVACANLSNLLLARGLERRTELRTRQALGGSQLQITRQLVAESLVVCLAGGALGLAVAWLATRSLMTLIPASIPGADQASVDLGVAVLGLLVTVVCGVVVGAVPARHATAAALGAADSRTSRGGTASATGVRLRSFLVAAQLALVVVLIVGSSLLMGSFWRLSRVDPGFQTSGRMVVYLDRPTRFAQDEIADIAAFYRAIRREVATVPGVDAVADITSVPTISPMGMTAYHLVEGRPAAPAGEEPLGGVEVVSPQYFELMGMEILSGRTLIESDTADSEPVVVINDAMAQRFWPDASPLGDRVRLGPASNGATVALPRRIVGVVRGVRYTLGAEVRPRMYLPDDQMPMPMTARGVLVHTRRGDPNALVSGIRAAVARVDPGQALGRTLLLEDAVADSVATQRGSAALVVAFGALALALGLLGVYGVVSYVVARRTREIGIRLALGAGAGRLVTRAIRDAMRPVMVGILAGSLASLLAGRLVQALLYETSANDPRILVGVAASLAAIAAVAAWLPARRIAAVDPLDSLRRD